MGRSRETGGRRAIRVLSRLGIGGTPQSAALPALVAATDPSAEGNRFYGRTRSISGGPARQLHRGPFRDTENGPRFWDASEQLVGLRFSSL